MFENKIPFFMSISRHIKFGTAEMIKSQKAPTLLAGIKQIKCAYLKRGFNITHILLDGQFEPLRGDTAAIGIALNVESRDERVPEAERYIWTVKERTRCIYNTLLFQRMPMRIIIAGVDDTNFENNDDDVENETENEKEPDNNNADADPAIAIAGDHRSVLRTQFNRKKGETGKHPVMWHE
jgi:hypothetical protein